MKFVPNRILIYIIFHRKSTFSQLETLSIRMNSSHIPERAPRPPQKTVNLTEAKIAHLIHQQSTFLGRPLTHDEIEMVHRQVAFDREHAGHESQHSKMALILLGSLIASQFLIGYWKRKSPSSYHLTTLLGLWIVPWIMGIQAGNWRFVIVHFLFSICNSWIVYRAMESPMRPRTPKLVYAWYSWVYTISYAIGVFGYVVLLMAFFHIPGLITGIFL